jgi:hypothetical protein
VDPRGDAREHVEPAVGEVEQVTNRALDGRSVLEAHIGAARW